MDIRYDPQAGLLPDEVPDHPWTANLGNGTAEIVAGKLRVSGAGPGTTSKPNYTLEEPRFADPNAEVLVLQVRASFVEFMDGLENRVALGRYSSPRDVAEHSLGTAPGFEVAALLGSGEERLQTPSLRSGAALRADCLAFSGAFHAPTMIDVRSRINFLDRCRCDPVWLGKKGIKRHSLGDSTEHREFSSSLRRR